jgi:hypothetical protein
VGADPVDFRGEDSASGMIADKSTGTHKTGRAGAGNAHWPVHHSRKRW